MKITICAYDAPNNIDGPTTWIKRLLPYLRKCGIEARILFMASHIKDLKTVAYFKKLNFKYKLIPAELFFEEQLQMILKDLATHPPDVFIPNYFPVGGYASKFAKSEGIPSVMILHNDDAYHRALVKEFGYGGKQMSLSCIVPVSKSLHAELTHLDLLDIVIECIPYGAPIPLQKAQWKKGERLKLIYLGRLNNHQKRIADVTRSFCRVTQKLSNVEAIIYGNGPSLKEVLNIIAKEGKGGAVSYGGALALHELQSKLLENHVYVLLSEFEGIPIALMEAMACGLVPVCSNIKSGITELIDNNVNGLIVNDRDDDFIQAIEDISENLQKWNSFSNHARSKIQADYADERCYDKWVSLLKDLGSQNRYTGSLTIPSVRELKKLQVPDHFLAAEVRVPHIAIVPMYRLKKLAGRLKRNYFK